MEKVRSYSGLFIIDPGKEDSLDSVKGEIKSILGENKGSVVEEKSMGKKALAFPIKKKQEGIYYEIVFTAMPSVIEKLSRLYRINANILRSVIDKLEK